MKLVYRQQRKIISPRPIYLICVFRDERILLEYFIKYYQSLGVTHFVMIDNLSIDDGPEYLISLNSINLWLYKTVESYRVAEFGTKWVNQLLYEHCVDQYCFVVDVDELFMFDTRKYDSLQDLVSAMEEVNVNVIPTTLLDMYPKETNDNYCAGYDFLDHSSYFDRYDSPYYEECNQIYGCFSHKIGGVRKRVLDTTVCIHKFPFFRVNFMPLGIAPGSHFFQQEGNVIGQSSRIRLYNEPGILLHFKFIKPDFKALVERRIENNQDWGGSKEYRAYQKALETNAVLEFYDENISRRLNDISSLDEFLSSL